MLGLIITAAETFEQRVKHCARSVYTCCLESFLQFETLPGGGTEAQEASEISTRPQAMNGGAALLLFSFINLSRKSYLGVYFIRLNVK